VSIQRNFLWGGASGSKKIAWVSWVDVCRSNECGGLRIINLRLVNISRLTKWRWQLMTSNDVFRVKVLKAKYGVEIVTSLDLSSWGNGAATRFLLDT
jgi:hypothetical protein